MHAHQVRACVDSLHPSPRVKKVLTDVSKTAGGPPREEFSPRALREVLRETYQAGRAASIRKQPSGKLRKR